MTEATPKMDHLAAIRAFVSDAGSEDIVRQALRDVGPHPCKISQGNVASAAAQLSGEASPALLIVDLGGVDDPVARIRELADVCEPNVQVIVIGDRNDIVLYRDLRNAGVSEYFVKPVVRSVLTRTCMTLLHPETSTTASRNGKLIVVVGVRGGVGATTIATSSAWHFAELRKRSTLLLDLNLRHGDAALQFGVEPNQALLEAFAYPNRVDRLFLDRGAIKVRERLDLLCCLEPVNRASALDETAAKSLLEKLLTKYRFVVVDLPQSLAANVWSFLELNGTCVIVSDQSLSSARDVARWRSALGGDAADRNTIHVLNERSRGGLTITEFTKAAGKRPDFVISHDKDLARAAALGVDASQASATFNRGLLPIVKNFTGEAQVKRTSVVHRIFG